MSAATAKYYFPFRITWRCCLQTVNLYRQTKFIGTSQCMADVWSFPVRINKRPQYCNCTSGYDFDHTAVMGMLFCIGLPNFTQMGTFRADLWCYIDFQVDGRYGAILLPASDWGRPSLQNVSLYQEPNFIGISQSAAISGLKKRTSILELYFRLPFRPYHRSRHVVLQQAAKCHPNRTIIGVVMML